MEFSDMWALSFPDLRIPVHVAHGGMYSAEHIGHAPDDVARVLLEVLARHNEAVAWPKLYFAGFADVGLDFNTTVFVENLPPGITIMSYDCTVPSDGNDDFLCFPFTSDAYACAFSTATDEELPIGWIILIPTDCPGFNFNRVWKLDEDNADLAQVLTHELGHTLGLQHSNRTQAECEAGGNIHGGTASKATSVMQSAIPYKYAAYRSWRRDDLAGLQQLYGNIPGSFEIAWWDDADYPEYPDLEHATSLTAMPVSRAAAVSGQVGATTQVLATTDPHGRVLHRLIDAVGNVTPGLADAIVDPSPHGITYAMPAAASGWQGADERAFVAWLADEVPEGSDVKLRVAVRSTASLDWQLHTHPAELWVNRLAAGFVPDFETFVITTLTGEGSRVALVLFDADGAPIGGPLVLADVQAFDVGVPVCAGARCLIPFSQPNFGGPDFGLLEVYVDTLTPTATVLSQELLSALDTRGRLELVDDLDGLLGSSGAGRFALGDYPGLEPDLAAQWNPAQDWPLSIGQWTTSEPTLRRMFQVQRVECGNGLVQGNESCDDGNAVRGDAAASSRWTTRSGAGTGTRCLAMGPVAGPRTRKPRTASAEPTEGRMHH